MIKKRLFIVRHGTTELNTKGYILGRLDFPLDDGGMKQANKLHKKLGDICFDKIITSSLIRTNQTVSMFIDKNIPVISLSNFDEISRGIKHGKIYDKHAKRINLNLKNKWRSGKTHVKISKGGESLDNFKRRLIKVAEYIKDDNSKNILICGHGGSISGLLCIFFQQEFQHMLDLYKCNHGEGFIVDFDGKKYHFVDYI